MIIDYFRGMIKGKRMAIQASGMTKAAINYLIMKDRRLTLPDTAFVLKESFAYCAFLSLRPNMPQAFAGSVIVTSKDILQDWLLRTFNEANRDYDHSMSVQAVIADLPRYHEDWLLKMVNKRQELQGRHYLNWVPSAIGEYIEHVDLYFHEKTAQIEYDFSLFLFNIALAGANNLLPRKDKKHLLGILEESLPAELKRKLNI